MKRFKGEDKTVVQISHKHENFGPVLWEFTFFPHPHYQATIPLAKKGNFALFEQIQSGNIQFNSKAHTLNLIYPQMDNCITQFQRDFQKIVMLSNLIIPISADPNYNIHGKTFTVDNSIFAFEFSGLSLKINYHENYWMQINCDTEKSTYVLTCGMNQVFSGHDSNPHHILLFHLEDYLNSTSDIVLFLKALDLTFSNIKEFFTKGASHNLRIGLIPRSISKYTCVFKNMAFLVKFRSNSEVVVSEYPSHHNNKAKFRPLPVFSQFALQLVENLKSSSEASSGDLPFFCNGYGIKQKHIESFVIGVVKYLGFLEQFTMLVKIGQELKFQQVRFERYIRYELQAAILEFVDYDFTELKLRVTVKDYSLPETSSAEGFFSSYLQKNRKNVTFFCKAFLMLFNLSKPFVIDLIKIIDLIQKTSQQDSPNAKRLEWHFFVPHKLQPNTFIKLNTLPNSNAVIIEDGIIWLLFEIQEGERSVMVGLKYNLITQKTEAWEKALPSDNATNQPVNTLQLIQKLSMDQSHSRLEKAIQNLPTFSESPLFSTISALLQKPIEELLNPDR